MGLKLSAIFLHRCVRWPSSELRAKYYGDKLSPRGTPPSGALTARGVSKYSDFGPIEGYISQQTVQDRRIVSIKDE